MSKIRILTYTLPHEMNTTFLLAEKKVNVQVYSNEERKSEVTMIKGNCNVNYRVNKNGKTSMFCHVL
jgi:hypothetical protein